MTTKTTTTTKKKKTKKTMTNMEAIDFLLDHMDSFEHKFPKKIDWKPIKPAVDRLKKAFDLETKEHVVLLFCVTAMYHDSMTKLLKWLLPTDDFSDEHQLYKATYKITQQYKYLCNVKGLLTVNNDNMFSSNYYCNQILCGNKSVTDDLKNLTESQFVSSIYNYLTKTLHVQHGFYDGKQGREIWNFVNRLCEYNPNLYLAKVIQQHNNKLDNKLVSHFWATLIALWRKERDNVWHIEDFIYLNVGFANITQLLSDSRSVLWKTGWLEPYNINGIASKEKFTLSKKGVKELLKPFDNSIQSEIDNTDVIEPDKISDIQLYFNEDTKDNYDRLKTLLQNEQFNAICQRLKEKNMSEGFTCIFYGLSGTGKTEAVNQIAKQTDRKILRVEISKIRDKWVGETEKNIAAVFEEYKTLCENTDNIPILLFNEADALFGNRNENTIHSVDKMENAMQNIILQKMEDFKGILIATTNLTGNLDPAFERRFLYKMEFTKPSRQTSLSIWKSILPDIEEHTLSTLNEQYDFTGGQIKNIARKYTVDEILYGKPMNQLEKLNIFCKEEKLNNKHQIKGFIN